MRKIVVGVMGPSEASKNDVENAYELGKLIALKGWVLLSGGGHRGVMHAVNEGAKSANGFTVGIIWADHDKEMSSFVDIAIVTGMGSARNNINVLSSDVVIACGIGAGTVSEIALGIKAKKQVIVLNQDEESKVFFHKLGKGCVHIAETPKEAIDIASSILASVSDRKPPMPQ